MTENKQIRTVCLTGHREIPERHALLLPALLEERMLGLIDRGARIFRAGGAIGFDMVATLKLLELKERVPELRLHLYLPCRDQTYGWDAPSVRAYRYILDWADETYYTVENYVKGCMLERDRRLVAGSDVCLAYCIRNRGGTFYTCSQALKSGLELCNLADELPGLREV